MVHTAFAEAVHAVAGNQPHEVHAEQLAAFAVVEKVPLAHAPQVRSAVALPLPVTWLPAAHGVQFVQLMAFVVVEKLPLGQASHVRSVVAVEAVLIRCPAVQEVSPVQTRSVVALGAVVSYCADVHAVQALQVVAFLVVLKLFAPHTAHCRSVVLVGAAVCLLPGKQSEIATQVRSDVAVADLDSYCVAPHSVSAVHVPLSAYLPAPQAEQTRSEVASGAMLSVSPAMQLVHALHMAVLGWELKVPAAQGAHARSDVPVGSILT